MSICTGRACGGSAFFDIFIKFFFLKHYSMDLKRQSTKSGLCPNTISLVDIAPKVTVHISNNFFSFQV